MKTSSCFFAPTSLGVCLAAAVFFASDLPAQNAVTSSPLTTQGTAVLQSKAKATGDTNALRESVAALQARVARAVPRALAEVQGTNQLAKTSADQGVIEASQVHALVLTEEAQTATEPPAGALESLIVNNHLLNVDFGDYTKTGPAAIGQTANDYWNPYVMPYYSLGTLQNILWSDQSASPVDITVANAPGQWGNGLCVDPMYASFIYPWDSGHITVTIADLPANTYDFYVYATRASDFSPVAQFQRAGVTLWTKGTTQWGEGWYSQYWDEGEQYVRFRNIAVNSQTITVDMHPDAAGYAAISGIQIVPSSAIPSEQPVITKLLNVDFGGTGSPYKVGFGAVGLTANDFWNGDYHPGNGAVTLANLKWSDQTVGPVAMTVLNGPGCWGNSLPDPMFRSYMYSWDGGNIRITLDNLPSGICDIYLYGHTPTADDNAVFELWSDDVNWGTKGTSLIGDGPTYATWEVGQQYVLFKDVTVTAGKPLIIHAKHTTYGYNNISGMQIAYTGAADTDADGLPDGWERRWFGNLDQIASADTDSDGLNNLREYQLGTDPARADSNANGLADLYDFEKVWVEDGTPQGGYEMGDNEWWNWVSYWYDGDGWGGQEVYPHSGRWWDPLMHVSDNVPGNLHQHYFSSSVATLRPAVGDVLYAYINLDSSYPPSEVMLQWYVVGEDGYGSWEHRAYWGADLIDAGQNGTASRYPMGSLPTAGQWVRLEVPASLVGLEGKIVEGMAFTLHGGRAAWDSAGTMKPDHDGDGLLDAWEMQYFGNLLQTATGDNDGDGLSNLGEYQHGTNPNNSDTDGDGLYDSEELGILLDASNPGLGYLNPLAYDTGATGKPDGKKDGDNDGITNLGELRKYFSDASNAHTFHAAKNDAEYFHMAFMGAVSDGLKLSNPSFPGGGLIQFSILNAPPNAAYDLYFVPAFTDPPMKWRRIFCGASGQRVFTLPQPDPTASFFVILDATDQDGDGLSDGYEAWFAYNSRHTKLDLDDSDPVPDLMLDGWEVSYGLDPTDNTGVNGAAGNPDGDAYPNFSIAPPLGEFNQNPLFAAPSYDPRTLYASTTTPARPVVKISSSAPGAYKLGGTASFTITRTIGAGANLNNPLTVYYSVGGTATYNTDYTLRDNLNNPPAGPPRVFSATIQAGQTSVTVTVTPTGAGLNQAGTQTIIIKLTPFAVATVPQISDPALEPSSAGCYAVNLHQEATTIGIHDGILINLEKTAPQGYLRIKPTSETTPLPFINVANSDRGTVARIYTGADRALGLSKVVGEYFSAPEGKGRNPSRTTVDRYGNVWVGNRAQGDLNVNGGQDDGNGGSIAQFGIMVGGTRCNSDGSPNANGDYLKPPFIYNTCIDRNRDGLIRTARGANLQLAWPNTGDADSLGGVSTAQDEAILRYLRVVPTGVRTIIIDTNNNLWVGSHVNSENEFIDATAAMQVTGRRLNFQAGGYGGVLDGYGAIWSSGYTGFENQSRLVRFLPGSTMPVTSGGTIRLTGDNYGIGLDPISGDVWQPLHHPASVMQFRADHCTTRFEIGQSGNRGVVVDGHGNIWVGSSADTVFHLTTSGVPIGAVPMVFQAVTGNSPLGLTVDSSGMIWAICQSASDGHGYAMRIDPEQNPDTDPNHFPPIGRVVEVVDLGNGTGPYNYSDMSGFVTLSTTQPSGVWDHIEDAVTADTLWSSLTMTANSPIGTRVIVEVRAANSIAELPSWPFRAIVNGDGVTPTGTTTLPSGIKGRYLEVRANLVRNFGITATPELRALTFQHESVPGCAIQITSHPLSKAVTPGAAATFTVTATVPGGATATYQWYKDGSLLSNGGNISGATTATLSVNNVSYTDAARYSVKVGTVSGCMFQVESAPARLHVRGSPPQLTQDLAPNVIVNEGQNVTLSAQASAGTGVGEKPIYYQWRFNNEPIVGASGNCGSGDCSINRVVAGQCANAGAYSVVFWNQYGQVSTVNCELSIAGRDTVSISPLFTQVTDPYQNVTLTATTCLGDVNCAQWYRIVGGQKVAVPNPGPNPLVYTVPTPMTCEVFGDYTVSIADRGWNSYEPATPATVAGPQFRARLTSTTLRIIPDNIGSGTWTYTWYYSTDGSSYSQVVPNPGTPDYTLATELSNGSIDSHYYRVVATRAGATASMDVDYVSDTRYGTWVRKIATTSATPSVTYTAGANVAGAAFHWFFRPAGGVEADTGVTTASYTVNPVDCSTRGFYRVQVTNTCGDSTDTQGEIQVPGCP